MHIPPVRLWWSLVLAAGCGHGFVEESPGVAAAGEVGRAEAPLETTNGRNLNGRNLNGRNLNGTEFDAPLTAVSLSGATLSGRELSEVRLEGSMLRGRWNGQEFSGQELEGAELKGVVGDVAEVPLRVTRIVQGAWPNQQDWQYYVEYRPAKDQPWRPICPDGQDGALPAFAVEGRWDYREGVAGGGAKSASSEVFTFGCEGGAIAKCIRMGYRPWASVNGASLDGYHQACVRLIRGDYCGDGRSHTTDGRLINVYDGQGVQDDTEPWLAEAEWDEGGARCFSLLNRSLLTICPTVRLDLTCGSSDHFQDGSLLISETPLGPVGVITDGW